MAPKPSIVPRLVVIEGKDKGKVIPLSNGTAVIGRTKGDVLVQDPRLSRSHIAIHYDAKTQKLSFTDLKSLNGTILNGAPAQTGELKDGDKLQLGNTLFDCQIGAPVDEETSVSKVRDQLQRDKDERAAKEASLSNSGRVEPGIAAVAEIPAVLADADSDLSGEISQEIPRSKTAAKKKLVEELPERPRQRATLSGLRMGVGRASGIRNVALGLVLILGLLYYANLGRTPSGGGTTADAAFESSAAPIRKLLSQGRVDDALKKATELRDNFETLADSHMLLGNILALQQKNEEAVQSYLKAKELSPDDPLVHTNLVRLYIKTTKMDEADGEMAIIDRMISEGKHTKALFVEVAQLLLEFRKELKQPPEKAMILAKALQTQLAPESSIGFKLEAQAHDMEGRKPEALAAVDQGLLVEPNDIWLLEHSAILRLELRDLAGATSTVEKWIERHPASNKPLLIMAYLKFQGGDPNGSVRYLQQILQAANNNLQVPEAREAIYLLGQIAFNQKSYKEAVELYKQSCQSGFTPACNQETAARSVLEGGAPPPEAAPENTEGAPQEDSRPPAALPPSAAEPPAQAAPPAAQIPADQVAAPTTKQ